MTWVVTADSQYQYGRLVMFANQPNPTDQWWTVVLHKAQLFAREDWAQALVKKLKYNNPQVRTLDEMIKIVAKWEELHYTAPRKKNNYDRQISPQPSSIATFRPGNDFVRSLRPAQLSLFESEYDYKLGGWGNEGR